MKTLLIPLKSDTERAAVAQAWERAGGKVLRVDRFWERPEIASQSPIAIYGNDTFALVLAQVMGVDLATPDDALITRLAGVWTRRRVVQLRLGALEVAHFPCFVKPVIPKQFKGQVYASLADLEGETGDLAPIEAVMVSEILGVEAEARAFVLDGAVQAVAVYEGAGDVDAVSEFLGRFAKQHLEVLPSAYVVDAGYDAQLGWWVMEFNSAWGAGLNGCDPNKVVACIAAATLSV
jgi:hypothetical protein